ncbi:MAG: glutamate-5-semialdehyde dehydrogenase [Dehalococcoidales bacterium]
MASAIEELKEQVKAAKASSRRLAYLSTEVKNQALLGIADSLESETDKILTANELDCKAAAAAGMNEALLERLTLSPSRIEGIAHDVRAVAALPDPVGEMFDMRTLPNGLLIGRKRTPFGVIGAIYESRPNVTIDIAVLCLKSGNAIILRGGKEAVHSNSALAAVVHNAATHAGMPEGVVQFIRNTDRGLIRELVRMKSDIDLIIPRGGEELQKNVADNATMPVLSGGIGVCHTYVEKKANLEMAVAIANNAKVQRPSVCNALDTLLVDSDIAADFLPLIATEWAKAGVEMRCDERALSILKVSDSSLRLVPATQDDWGKEFLALVAAVRVVDSLDEALEHITRYGSGSDEAIVTEDYTAANRFLNEVDAATVYVNASTRFTDGGQFGLGAEVAISTQKMHARGPIGLRELTTYKWIVYGSGQIRP